MGYTVPGQFMPTLPAWKRPAPRMAQSRPRRALPEGRTWSEPMGYKGVLVGLGNPGGIQFGHCGKSLKPCDFRGIFCPGNLDPDFPETSRHGIQLDDFPGCPVHRHAKISVFGR